MKSFWYLLAVVLGAFGALGVLRSIERIITGAGVSPVQVFIGLVGLAVAWLCIRKARSRPSD
jgi:Co/Zn/Cd efflux system component